MAYSDIVGAVQNPANAGVVNTITSVAQQLGVDPNLALATAYKESGFNPTAVGDKGSSFGLFQLHRGGELGSLTQQQAFDPSTNARTALSVLANIRGIGSPGDVAAAAQRPADPAAYAKVVNGYYAALTGGSVGTINTTGVPTQGSPTLYGSAEAPSNALTNDEGYLFQWGSVQLDPLKSIPLIGGLFPSAATPTIGLRRSTARKIIGTMAGVGGIVIMAAGVFVVIGGRGRGPTKIIVEGIRQRGTTRREIFRQENINQRSQERASEKRSRTRTDQGPEEPF